jgi:DNA processing protein
MEESQPSECQLAWLALALTPGLGPRRILQASRTLQDISRIFYLSLTELESLNFPAPAVQFIADGRARGQAEEEFGRVREHGGTVLAFSDEAYPEQLREIFDPPPVLWLRGNAGLLSRPGIAVV